MEIIHNGWYFLYVVKRERKWCERERVEWGEEKRAYSVVYVFWKEKRAFKAKLEFLGMRKKNWYVDLVLI